MATCAPSEAALVTMKSGLVVRLEALQVLWRLEDDGMVVKVDDTGRLLVGPTNRLTPADDRAIREYRDEIVALVKMCNEVDAVVA